MFVLFVLYMLCMCAVVVFGFVRCVFANCCLLCVFYMMLFLSARCFLCSDIRACFSVFAFCMYACCCFPALRNIVCVFVFVCFCLLLSVWVCADFSCLSS